MSDAATFLRERGICPLCHLSEASCDAQAPGDYAAHDRFWRANNVTSRRPWWTSEELAQIIRRQEAAR